MKSVVKKEKIVGGLLAGSRAIKKKGADMSGKIGFRADLQGSNFSLDLLLFF